MNTKMNSPRLSEQGLKVLARFMASPSDEFSGAELHKDTRLASGTLYPLLLRLEDCGWLSSRWEQIEPREAGRPRRRLYRITGLGQRGYSEVMASLGFGHGRPEWA